MAESKANLATNALTLDVNAGIREKIQPYYYLCKPGIVYSNVLSGAAGYIFASRWHLDIKSLTALMLGSGLIISSACVANNFMDRSIDSKMKRTYKRASVTGIVSARNMILFSVILGIVGFSFLFLTNLLTVLIGVFAFVAYVFIYGYAKRRSVYGTFVGTLPGGASIVAGYTAATGKFEFGALILLLIMIAWQMTHFYSIAIYRIEDYKKASIPLWPIKRGIKSTKIQIGLFALLFIAANWTLSILSSAGIIYASVMSIVGILWFRLILQGLHAKNDQLWAKKTFLFSLVVLLTFFTALPFSFVLP